MGFKVDLQEWVFWPEREDLSIEFMRLLAAAQEGGSTLAECWVTAKRIDFSDDDSWCREWTQLADANDAKIDWQLFREQGDRAEQLAARRELLSGRRFPLRQHRAQTPIRCREHA